MNLINKILVFDFIITFFLLSFILTPKLFPDTDFAVQASFDDAWQACIIVVGEMGETIEKKEYYQKIITTRKRIYLENYEMKDWRHFFTIVFKETSNSQISILIERKVQKAIRIYPRSENDWYRAQSDGKYEDKFRELLIKEIEKRKRAAEKSKSNQTNEAKAIASKVAPKGSSGQLDDQKTNPIPDSQSNKSFSSTYQTSSEDNQQEDEDLFEQAVSGKISFEDYGNIEGKKPASAKRNTFDFNGYVRGDVFYGEAEETDKNELKQAYGELDFNVIYRSEKLADAFVDIRLGGIYDNEETKPEAEIREAYMNFYASHFDLRAGLQIISWGCADVFNPTDNLTPRDMRIHSPDSDDIRIANFGFRAHVLLFGNRLELIYLPFFRASHFPDFSLSPQISLSDTQNSEWDLSSGTAAVRYLIEKHGYDASFSYFNGQSTFPGIQYENAYLENGQSLNVLLAYKSYSQQVLGFDFSTTLGNFAGFRCEAAYRNPLEGKDAEYAPLSDFSLVVGVDKEFFTRLSVIFQYIGRYVFDFKKVESTGLLGQTSTFQTEADDLKQWFYSRNFNKNTDLPPEIIALIQQEVLRQNRILFEQTEEISQGFTLRLELKLFQDSLSLEALGYMNITLEEQFLRPLIRYDINDNLWLKCGAELYQGKEDTLFDMIDKTMSAVFFELQYSF